MTRSAAEVEAHLELDHYGESLIRKPGATALEQALARGGNSFNLVRREHT